MYLPKGTCCFYHVSLFEFPKCCTNLQFTLLAEVCKDSHSYLPMSVVSGIFTPPSLLGMKWYLIMALIWISLVTCKMEHDFMWIGPSGLLCYDLLVHLFGPCFLSCSFTFSLIWSSLWVLDVNVNTCFWAFDLQFCDGFWRLMVKICSLASSLVCALLLVWKSFPTLRLWTDGSLFFSDRFKVWLFTLRSLVPFEVISMCIFFLISVCVFSFCSTSIKWKVFYFPLPVELFFSSSFFALFSMSFEGMESKHLYSKILANSALFSKP